MSGAVLAGRTRDEELMLTRMKKYMEIETRSSTGAGTRDLRRMRTRTPLYSRTLREGVKKKNH